MPRPIKCRRVAFIPDITYFKPAGIPLRVLEEVCLSVEEAEALRLKDLEALEQEQCAEKMKVSRPTFHRILGSARHKLADALLNGKAIRIEGGTFELASKRFRCFQGHEWEIPSEELTGSPGACPRCGTDNLLPIQPGCAGRGWKHRWGRCRMDGPNAADQKQTNPEPKERSHEDTG